MDVPRSKPIVGILEAFTMFANTAHSPNNNKKQNGSRNRSLMYTCSLVSLKGMESQQIKPYNSKSQDNEKNELTPEEQPKAKRELFFDTSKVIRTYPIINKSKSGLSKFSEKNSIADVKQEVNTANNSQNNETLSDFKKLTPSQETLPSTNETNFDKAPNFDLVRCPCLSTENFDIMFRCSGCFYLNHFVCYGILYLEDFKKYKFYCHLCHQPEGKHKCHDKMMVTLKNSSDQQKVAVLRKVLQYCHYRNIQGITLIKMKKIAGLKCSQKVVEIILNKMIEIGVAIPQKGKKTFLLDKIKLKKEIPYYFYQLQNLSKTKTDTKAT